jgi:hypothetical protein
VRDINDNKNLDGDINRDFPPFATTRPTLRGKRKTPAVDIPSDANGAGGGERGEIAVDISVEIFVIIYIPHNDTFLF